jgi:hypothetical protein
MGPPEAGLSIGAPRSRIRAMDLPDVRYRTTVDGVRIAYSVGGSAYLEGLSQLVRYDEGGMGLSDRVVTERSTGSRLRDECVHCRTWRDR